MPFTLAHPAIAIPLKRLNGKLSVTALAVGSMVPDFENYFRMQEQHNSWHHRNGILFFAIPIGILCCYLFHNLLKTTFINNLPTWYRKRFETDLHVNWNRFVAKNKAAVFISLLAGIVLHLFWDGFTHQDGIFVKMIPFLTVSFDLAGYLIPVHFILQVISSIAGLFYLQILIARLPLNPGNNIAAKSNPYYWPILFLVMAAIILTRLWASPGIHIYLAILKACIGAFLYAWVLVSLIFKLIEKYQTSTALNE